MKYEWILFDADGTLFDYDKAEGYALENAFAALNLPFHDHCLCRYNEINALVWKEFEQGRISARALRTERFKRLLNELGMTCDPHTLGETYLSFFSQADFLVEDAMEVVSELSAQFKLAIITNGLKDVQRSRFGKSPLRLCFREIIISEDVGVAKPDVEFFEHAFKKMSHARKDSVVVVGDSLSSDIQGGRNFGVDTCWFNPAGRPNNSGITPTYEIAELKELPGIFL